MEDARQKSKTETRELLERNDKIKELNLKLQVLADDSEKDATLQAQITAGNVELIVMHVSALQSTKAMEPMNWSEESLPSKVDAPHSAGGHREGMLRGFVESVCTG